MLKLCNKTRVYIWTGATDMRRSFDMLSEMAKVHMNRAVMSGGLYVFFNRFRDKVKLLYWDADGYALWYKRLEAGTFKVRAQENGHEEITGVDLKLLLAGMDYSRLQIRKKVKEGVYSKRE